MPTDVRGLAGVSLESSVDSMEPINSMDSVDSMESMSPHMKPASSFCWGVLYPTDAIGLAAASLESSVDGNVHLASGSVSTVTSTRTSTSW